ncbi:MAG: sigma-54-dependent Fis family transcriptional regulator [Planctomycetota bacterium]|nr:sigma-54-dependent Fis family transcriptional regulator [Planctomycetota bacterium]
MEEQDIYRTIVPVLMETDPEQVLESALDALMDVSGAERGCLVIPLGEESQSFAVEFARGQWPKDPASHERNVSRTVLNETIKNGNTIVLDNALENPNFMHKESIIGLKLMSVLAVPIWTLPRGSLPVAAIYLDHLSKIGAFTKEMVEAVETICEMLGPRIEQAWRFDRLRNSEQSLRRKLKDSDPKNVPVGNSVSFQNIVQAGRQVAMSDVPVLILGECGTGKEVMARMIHEFSPFSEGPWVAINCGALPQDLLESELFGHEKGAYTGATSARVGKIASAASGTLFLDEVGELTPSCQTRFLRVLQTGEIQRVGSDRTMTVKFRLVAATNKDLRELIKEGLFREDLYYRLNVIPLTMPNLRDRGDDVLLLAQKFLSDYARGNGRIPPRIAPEARVAMLNYSWPGNVREVENAMRRALVFCTGEVVELGHLPPELNNGQTSALPSSLSPVSSVVPQEIPLTKDGFEQAKRNAVLEVERGFLTRALTAAGGNLSRVSRETGLNRAVLYDMLKRLEIDPSVFRSGIDNA